MTDQELLQMPGVPERQSAQHLQLANPPGGKASAVKEPEPVLADPDLVAQMKADTALLKAVTTQRSEKTPTVIREEIQHEVPDVTAKEQRYDIYTPAPEGAVLVRGHKGPLRQSVPPRAQARALTHRARRRA